MTTASCPPTATHFPFGAKAASIMSEARDKALGYYYYETVNYETVN
jgi:hypothetical protein